MMNLNYTVLSHIMLFFSLVCYSEIMDPNVNYNPTRYAKICVIGIFNCIGVKWSEAGLIIQTDGLFYNVQIICLLSCKM